MNRMLLLAVLVVVLPSALAHIGHDDTQVRTQILVAEGSLGPQAMAEVNFKMHANDTIMYSMSASKEVAMDIHEHVDSSATVAHVDEPSVVESEGSFRAPHDGAFSLMIQSGEGGADVDVVIEGNFGLVDVFNLEVTSDGAESPMVPVVVLLAVLAFLVRRR